jgi:glycosyltransferase involved in cell wall biosynthesis
MKTYLSVLLCTHNPQPQHLIRTLDALRAQTLPRDSWELVVVDNASTTSVEKHFDFADLPIRKIVTEHTPGVVAARLRSFAECQGDLCVIVDDDNLLIPQFLARTAEHSRNWPELGAWGACIKPEFKGPSPAWTTPFLGDLAIYEFDQPRWGNVRHAELSPRGAGMTIRREVMQRFADLLEKEPVFKKIGRSQRAPESITGEDTVIGLEALRHGWGLGNFPDLVVTHILPPERLTENYLKKMAFGMAKSWTLINWMWGMGGGYVRRGCLRRLLEGYRIILAGTGPARRVRLASWRGTGAGIALIDRLRAEGVVPLQSS